MSFSCCVSLHTKKKFREPFEKKAAVCSLVACAAVCHKNYTGCRCVFFRIF